MLIIGCDFHTRFQQIAMVDNLTGFGRASCMRCINVLPELLWLYLNAAADFRKDKKERVRSRFPTWDKSFHKYRTQLAIIFHLIAPQIKFGRIYIIEVMNQDDLM